MRTSCILLSAVTVLLMMLFSRLYPLLLSLPVLPALVGPLMWFAVILCVVAPLLEELGKWAIVMAGGSSFQMTVVVAYSFQVAEAVFFSSIEVTWWVRLLLPLHVLFSLVTVRYGLPAGSMLHSLWNTQQFIGPSSPSFFIPLSYVALLYVLWAIGKSSDQTIL